MAEKARTKTMSSSFSIDSAAAEQDRSDLPWCLTSSTTSRVRAKHCEGRDRVVANDPDTIGRDVGAGESGELVAQPSSHQPLVELRLAGIEVVEPMIGAQRLDRREAAAQLVNGDGRSKSSAVLALRRPFRDTRRSNASHVLASSTT